MRQFSGCSTPAPRSSAAKQWFEELAQTKKTLNDKVYNNVDVGVVENLCDVVIGQDFQRQHPRVVFEYGGPKQDSSYPLHQSKLALSLPLTRNVRLDLLTPRQMVVQQLYSRGGIVHLILSSIKQK